MEECAREDQDGGTKKRRVLPIEITQQPHVAKIKTIVEGTALQGPLGIIHSLSLNSSCVSSPQFPQFRPYFRGQWRSKHVPAAGLAMYDVGPR